MEQEHLQSFHALQIAFLTMKDRCQQLQARLSIAEKENTCLRQQYDEYNLVDTKMINNLCEDKVNICSQKIIEELKKQKSHLIHHTYMVSSENRQLWIRLNKLMHANKSLEILRPDASNKDIEQYFKEKECSLKESSLCVINSNITEKSELEHQFAEIIKVRTNTEVNLKNIGFTYLEDVGEDSLENLKFYDLKLTKIREALLFQQKQLSGTLQNLKKVNKSKICDRCKQKSKEELVHQTRDQLDLSSGLKENKATQTSPLTLNLLPDDNNDSNENICPMCGITYENTLSFDLFHEHVVGHFTK